MSIVNTGDDANLIACIEAIRASAVLCNVLIAHNANNCMGGFAKAHNDNVKRGAAPYVLILNPDVFVHRECIDRAIDCMKAHRARIVGARFTDNRSLWGMPDWSGRVGPCEYREDLTQSVRHVMGAFMLLRRETWELVGGFDERFSPLYYEDLDLCLRVGNCWHCAGARATHIGCATTDRMKWRRRYWHTKNRLKFLLKWRGKYGCA